MSAPKAIADLTQRFSRNYDAYLSGQYNETQLRREFIDPFFEALGWDVNNKQGYAEAYKDVIHEDAIKIGGHTKAPDYCFRIGGSRKFFVEAKKPSININVDIEPAFQLRRYAWSAKLPLSILTNFDEFAVYDCRIKPVSTDKASIARILHKRYEEIPHCWEEIASIFSRESILLGSFDKYVESSKAKKGTAEVDDAFLEEIESWRDLLARQLALRNPKLSQHEMNFAVQSIIDRVVFLRICEDRGIEEYGSLLAQTEGDKIYERLFQLFQKADARYNSGLFHFRSERGRTESPDELTPYLSVDDKPLRDIIKNLYYPDSPYEFSVLPADILGQVYEQFLGKLIRLTAGHRAVVEDKPEVKKAGGVYYTPTYIVGYIVENTLGRKLEDKNPKQIEKLKILDPACGSGSFLLVAYQYLLDWYREWYAKNDPQKWATGRTPTIYQGSGGGWMLTTATRKRILLNNIYGVDIDPQAVEVTKLSLLLKVLEGENVQTLNRQLTLFHERALPDLSDNIKCGNSLVGVDFWKDRQISFLESERDRINTFDWEAGFSEIMRNRGFDVVIGNPPWAFTKYVDWGEETKNYIYKCYLDDLDNGEGDLAKQSGKINMFAIFVLKGLSLLKKDGLFGYIVPNNILRTTIYDDVRKKLISSYVLNRIVSLGPGVFPGVTASTVILLLKNEAPVDSHLIEVVDNQLRNAIQKSISNQVNQVSCLKNPSCIIDIFTDTNLKRVFLKMERKSIKLGELVEVSNGIATYKNKSGILDARKDVNSKPILFGRDIARYYYSWSGKYVDYVRNYLLRARDEKIFLASEKLIMQRIGGILVTAYDDRQFYTFNSINNLIPKEETKYNLKYILGILNSHLMQLFYVTKFTNRSALTVNVPKTFLDQIPIRRLNLNNPEEMGYHDRMVELVQQMISIKKQLVSAKTDHEKDALQRQSDAVEDQINRLVYDLYDLIKEAGIIKTAKII